MAFFPKLMLSPYHRWKELEHRKIEMFQQWCPVGKNWFFWRKRLYQDDIFGWRRRLLDWINRWGDWRKLEMVWRKHSRRISKVASKPANWHYFAELWWNKNGIVSAREFRCRVARSQLWRNQRVHLWKIKFGDRFHYILGIYLSLVIVYLPAYSFVPPICSLFIFYFYGSWYLLWLRIHVGTQKAIR